MKKYIIFDKIVSTFKKSSPPKNTAFPRRVSLTRELGKYLSANNLDEIHKKNEKIDLLGDKIPMLVIELLSSHI